MPEFIANFTKIIPLTPYLEALKIMVVQHGSDSVSYTHLDVYKRQIQYKMKTYTLKTLALASILSFVACKNENPDQLTEGKTKKEVVSFAPKVTGRILKIYVEEGQTVKAGDTLAMLDVPEVSAKIAQAKGATAAATAQAQMAKNGATADQLRQLKAKQKGLTEQYEYAQKSFKRAQNMFKDSLLSPQNYDEAYAKLQGAKAQYDLSLIHI